MVPSLRMKRYLLGKPKDFRTLPLSVYQCIHLICSQNIYFFLLKIRLYTLYRAALYISLSLPILEFFFFE